MKKKTIKMFHGGTFNQNQEKSQNEKPTLSKEEQRKKNAELRNLTAPLRKKIEGDENSLRNWAKNWQQLKSN